MSQAIEKLLTVQEVADLLNCKRDHVRALIADGKIEAFNIGLGKTKQWRIYESAVQSFLHPPKKRQQPKQVIERSEFVSKVLG